MSRGSFGRTVARAAASGGSKSYRARPPAFWYLSLVLIVVVGVGLIVYSRNEAVHKASASTTAPTAKDNWYTAVAFDVCGTLQPDLPANTNLSTAGIRTFGDGIVNTNPGAVAGSSKFTGAHATLGTFVATYGHGLAVSRGALVLPAKGAVTASTTTTTAPSTSSSTTSTTGASSTTTSTSATSTTSASSKAKKKASTPAVAAPKVDRYATGGTCRKGPDAGKKAAVEVETWSSPTATGSLFTGDPSTIRLTNGGMITVAYVPPGSTIPAPHSKSTLLQDLGKK